VIMRSWLLVALALCASALSPVGARAATAAYVLCSDHMQSPDPVWMSIANRL